MSIFHRFLRRNKIEHEKMDRLEQAEREVRTLRLRSDRAVRTLAERHARNHWRESIEQMIQGEA